MKYFWIPAAVLALLLGLALWNAHVVREETDEWRRIIEAARSDARKGDTTAAAAHMAELEEAWRARRRRYHSILEHDELDDVEEGIARAESALESGDGAGFAAETAALIGRLHILAEMQGLSIENVL